MVLEVPSVPRVTIKIQLLNSLNYNLLRCSFERNNRHSHVSIKNFTDALEAVESLTQGTSNYPLALRTALDKLCQAVSLFESPRNPAPVPETQPNVPYDVYSSNGCSRDPFTMCGNSHQATAVSQVPLVL